MLSTAVSPLIAHIITQFDNSKINSLKNGNKKKTNNKNSSLSMKSFSARVMCISGRMEIGLFRETAAMWQREESSCCSDGAGELTMVFVLNCYNSAEYTSANVSQGVANYLIVSEFIHNIPMRFQMLVNCADETFLILKNKCGGCSYRVEVH